LTDALVVQVHLDRAPDLDLDRLIEFLTDVVGATKTAEEFQTLADETLRYRDLAFRTHDLAALWQVLQPALYDDPLHGAALADATIVICEGEQGWDDYLLLHHFDREQPLDRFA
jgi:hypothetical protein